MSKAINLLQPGPGRWGNVTEHTRQFMDTLHTIADAELSCNKIIFNFWLNNQPKGELPRDPIVRQVAEEVRKIAYREQWYSAGDQYPTQLIAWRICFDWGLQT